MARTYALTDEERSAVQARMARWIKEQPKKSWRVRVDEIRDKTGMSLSIQGLIDASKGVVGLKSVRILESFFDESMSSWMKPPSAAGSRVAPPPRKSQRNGEPIAPTERFDTVGVTFARARSVGVNDHTLEAVRIKLGLDRAATAPTMEELERAIADELRERQRVLSVWGVADGKPTAPKR